MLKTLSIKLFEVYINYELQIGIKMFTPFNVTGCSLELLRMGERGIITFCKSQDKTILKKLISMGLTPGTTITLERYFPSFIIKVEKRILTIDRESTRAIYVHVVDS